MRADAQAYLNGARDGQLRQIAEFADSADGQEALQRTLAPLLNYEASTLEINYGQLSVRITTKEMLEAKRTLYERNAATRVAAASIEPETIDETLDSVEVDIWKC